LLWKRNGNGVQDADDESQQEGCFGKEMVMEYKMQMMKASKKVALEKKW